MKIEKINENQIRCTLTKDDLIDRNIKLSELAFNSGKTRELFQDMMRVANDDFGFEVDNMPIMVEVMPLSSDNIVLVITKVEDKADMEDPFSKFLSKGLKDGILSQMEANGLELDLDDISDMAGQHLDQLEAVDNSSISNEEDSLLYSIYTFEDLSQLITVSKLIAPFFKGDSAVFKSPFNNKFYLSICMDVDNEDAMVRTCGVLTEHGTRENPTYAKELFYIEHFDEIIGTNAIEQLSRI